MSSSGSQQWKEVLANPQQRADLAAEQLLLQSRRILLQCYFEAQQDTKAAFALYRQQVRKGVAHDYDRLDRELNYVMSKWVQDSSMQTRPHTHHQPTVPDEVIRQFAFKLAEGHSIPICTFVNDQPVTSWEHRPYYTLAEAAAADPYISDVMSSYSDKSALLRRAKQLEPDLHYGFEHIRQEVSADLKQRRMAYATRQLQRAAVEPEFLLNMFCEDEFSMYLASEHDSIVRSWGRKSAQAHATPQYCKWLGKGKQVKLHIMLVVSPRYGVTWCDFLTGTTAVDGGHVHLEEGMRPSITARQGHVFMTVNSGFEEEARGPTAQEMKDEFVAWIKKAKELACGRHPIYITYDNPSIHPKAQDLPALGLPAASDLELPPHSPDFHMLVEHTNNRVKRGINLACTKHGWNNLSASKWISIVKGVAQSIPAESIRADLANLITCYKIVSKPEGEPVEGMPAWVKGTGGGYPPHMFC